MVVEGIWTTIELSPTDGESRTTVERLPLVDDWTAVKIPPTVDIQW